MYGDVGRDVGGDDGRDVGRDVGRDRDLLSPILRTVYTSYDDCLEYWFHKSRGIDSRDIRELFTLLESTIMVFDEFVSVFIEFDFI